MKGKTFVESALQYKILLAGAIVALLFMVFLLPPAQRLCMYVINTAFHKSFPLDDVWRARFVEHSLKAAFIVLVSAAVMQFFSLESTDSDQPSLRPHLPYFAVCAFVVVGLCSTCSPIYPLHTWDDSNAFFTVGKCVWYGKVMYRDIYEQKGPLLYFLHSFAYLISHKTFVGVYIMEVIAATASMLYAHKTLCLFTKAHTTIGVLLPVFLVLVYTSAALKFGDSAEEFCLPMIMYALYVSVLHIKECSEFTKKELLVTGILAGCVLWIKFTLLGFFIGWAIVPVAQYIRRGRVRQVFIAAALVLAGAAIATVPYIIYFGANHAISDWFGVYIHDNIFVYSTNHIGRLPLPLMIAKGIGWAYWRDTLMLFATILSVIVLRRSKAILMHVIFMCLIGGFFIYCGGRTHIYYGFDFWAFAIFALLPICALINKIIEHTDIKPYGKTIIALISAAVFSALLAFCLTPNRCIMCIKKDDLPQFRFAKIILQRRDPTLLVYGMLDSSFYTVSGIVPNNKYFVAINMPLQEMYDAQDKVVREGLVDFIVTNREINAEKYRLADSADIKISHIYQVFYLYQLCE